MSRVAIGIGLLVLAAVILAVLFARPVVDYWRGRTADAEAGQEQAIDNAVGRGLEVEGTETIAEAAGQERASVVIIRERAHDIEIRTRADPDAAADLPPGVADRIREFDRVLCDSGLKCRSRGAAAATGLAGGDAGALRPDGDGEPDPR